MTRKIVRRSTLEEKKCNITEHCESLVHILSVNIAFSFVSFFHSLPFKTICVLYLSVFQEGHILYKETFQSKDLKGGLGLSETTTDITHL